MSKTQPNKIILRMPPEDEQRIRRILVDAGIREKAIEHEPMTETKAGGETHITADTVDPDDHAEVDLPAADVRQDAYAHDADADLDAALADAIDAARRGGNEWLASMLEYHLGSHYYESMLAGDDR